VDSCDATSEPKTGDQMYGIMSNSKQKMEDEYGVKVVAWCSDNGPDSKKGR
jgi:hypothetical protein